MGTPEGEIYNPRPNRTDTKHAQAALGKNGNNAFVWAAMIELNFFALF